MENVIAVLQILLEDWQDIVVGGFMLACSVIFIMGLGKKLGLNKIKNKHFKKAILYFGSMLMVLPTTALYLLVEGINFRWYWLACLLIAILTTITYCFYENSGLRSLIHLIGGKSVGKVLGVFSLAFRDNMDNGATVEQLTMTTEELKEEVKRDLRGYFKEDFDLTDL